MGACEMENFGYSLYGDIVKLPEPPKAQGTAVRTKVGMQQTRESGSDGNNPRDLLWSFEPN